jgi:hypothetical protein
MNTKEIREYKKTLKLNDVQRSILIGTLLGDGHLETQDNGKTYRLKIEHQLAQRDYLEWIYNQFKGWVPGGIRTRIKKNGYEYVLFDTYSHGAFRFYAQQFYPNGKKEIPKLIEKLLDPMVLAIWFMDDGSWKSNLHKTYIIHTLGYSKEDLELVQKILKRKFGLETSLHAQKEKYWRLYVKSEFAVKFKELIEPYTSQILSMQNKMGNRNA